MSEHVNTLVEKPGSQLRKRYNGRLKCGHLLLPGEEKDSR